MRNKQRPLFRQYLLTWYQRCKRDLPWRKSRDPYRIWVSEVMLQQTQVKTVVPYYERFIARYPHVGALAGADLNDVLKSWEGMGYYARARNLHRAARVVTNELAGAIPTDYASLRKLPGVGDYIAAAVASIAFGEARAVVDGNVRRVLSRLDTMTEPVNAPASAATYASAANALLDREHPGDYNQALMELGATLCRPSRPRCDECPVATMCEARRRDRIDEFPRRMPRKQKPHYHIAVGVVQRGDRVLITRRKEDGLLGGLWEFPGGKVQAGETATDACRREIAEEVNVDIDVDAYLTRVDHAYTHFRISVDVFACRYLGGDVVLNGASDHRWVLVDELDDYPFPAANHKFLPLVKKRLKP